MAASMEINVAMNILVTGGAGYVGSHAARLLEKAGHDVWVYDNLELGHRQAVRSERLIVGNTGDRKLLPDVLRSKKIDAVMHYAAYALVGESVSHPDKYYHNNVIQTLHLLESMREADVRKFVFSSTTATYGVPKTIPITEAEDQKPINPYGFSKLVIEQALRDYAHAYDWAFAAMRYFNASGASPDGMIGEDHSPESHLIPIVLQVALGQRDKIMIFGDDYPTPDGTCIRDYIHVNDLGTAHVKALDKLEPGQGLQLNLGTGKGYSVLEVIQACRKITGHEIPAEVAPRRPGDPPELVANSDLAQATLDWKPKFDTIESIIETAWNWHKSHPSGYSEKH